MTMSPELLAYMAKQDGRCQSCGCHIEKQGHSIACAEGAIRRDHALGATTAAHLDDAAKVDAVLADFIRRGREFSSNDTRARLAGVKGSVIGARFNAAARSRQIRRVGYTPSTDPGTHGHPVAVWLPT